VATIPPRILVDWCRVSDVVVTRLRAVEAIEAIKKPRSDDSRLSLTESVECVEA